MTAIVWDDVGDRLFETGLDRGVFYRNGFGYGGVPWNGLLSVVEDRSGTTSTPLYFDGVKYMNHVQPTDFSATLKAYTYPDEFLPCEGVENVGINGMFFANQKPVLFGLSYRTRIGNDVDGVDHGYKLHLVYNLTAIPQNSTHQTLNNVVNPTEFSWVVSSVPVSRFNYRDISHVIFDSRTTDPILLEALEEVLYGNISVDGRLPDISELFTIATVFNDITITDNGDGTWTATGPDLLFTMIDSTTFQIDSVYSVYIDADTYQVSSS